MLETTECIPIRNNGRDYTDCMEFSLLRFLHMIFYSEDQIRKAGLSDYHLDLHPKLKLNQDLIEFVKTYPEIYQSSDYYINSHGVKEREAWAKFISDRSYFEYYRTDGAELFTHVKNILILCKELLGINLDLTKDHKDNLKIVSSKLSTKNKIINIFINEEEKKVSSMPLSNIKKYLSKIQQDIYDLDNKNYNVSINNTLVSLQIGSNIYNWHLYEIYFQDNLPISNKFITGHSVIIYDK
jgi:hypothetical protein